MRALVALRTATKRFSADSLSDKDALWMADVLIPKLMVKHVAETKNIDKITNLALMVKVISGSQAYCILELSWGAFTPRP